MLEHMTNPTFLAVSAIGLIIVLLFSLDKFNEPSFSRRVDEPETLFLPKFLALRTQYVRGLFLYISGSELFYVLFALGGPKLFSNMHLSSVEVAPEVWPLSAALIITGVIPNLKWLQVVEAKWRRVCHVNAYIPDGAKETAYKITHARFDGAAYKADVGSDPVLSELRDVFDDKDDRVIRNWVKLSCILHVLGQPLSDAETPTENFDNNFLSAYKSEIDQLRADHKRTLKLFKHYIAAKAKGKSEDELAEVSGELVQDLRRLMRRSCTILSCAVRAKQSSEEAVTRALTEVGFTISSGMNTNRGLMDILFTSFVGVCITIFVGVYLSQNMMHSDNVFREGYSRLDLAVLWAFLTLGFHGIAAVVAAYLRERKLRHGTWTGRPLQKAGISLVGATSGYIFLLTYIAASRGLSPIEFLRALIWVPLPFITAYCTLEFFGIQLGNNKLENALRSGLDGVIQGGVTALSCVFVTQAWMEISPIAAKAPAGDALEWTKFVILNVFVLGSSLGIMFPAAYRRASQLVDEEIVKNRRDRLEQLAAKVLTTQIERDKWLKTPLKELDGVSPAAAATSFYLFNRAEQILHRRMTLQEV